MFTSQQKMFEQALIRGGMDANAAKEAGDALGNCIAALVHRGPVLLDYTPKQFRFIGPEQRKYQFPGVDVPTSNPDFVAPTIPLGEGAPIEGLAPVEPLNARSPFGPTQDPSEAPDSPNPQDPWTLGPLRKQRVLVGLKLDRAKGCYIASYMTIWCYGGYNLEQEPLYGTQVEIVTDVRVNAGGPEPKVYIDKQLCGVLIAGPVRPGATTIMGTTCDSGPAGGGA